MTKRTLILLGMILLVVIGVTLLFTSTKSVAIQFLGFSRAKDGTFYADFSVRNRNGAFIGGVEIVYKEKDHLTGAFNPAASIRETISEEFMVPVTTTNANLEFIFQVCPRTLRERLKERFGRSVKVSPRETIQASCYFLTTEVNVAR